ncbi:hypothetical protein SASPL_133485 [Salvia splendens]|uniref:Autophagy-related protein 101 n=1 Tax=Salvia splendens TaxID=180675 RepID=A0A8X8X2S6_SALSN|nr:hypothetical protein SASPL_133485 [Salvia splendens]
MLSTLRYAKFFVVQCGDVELERKVDEKIDQFLDRVDKHPNKKNQVKNKQPTWFTNKVERLYWEQWYINLNVAPHQKGHSGKSTSSKIVVDPKAEERTVRRAALEASLRDVLFQMIRFVNEKKDHIPPIPNLEGVSFPYEITISRVTELMVNISLGLRFVVLSAGMSKPCWVKDFVSSDSAFGMEMFKRMLQTGHPTMLS